MVPVEYLVGVVAIMAVFSIFVMVIALIMVNETLKRVTSLK